MPRDKRDPATRKPSPYEGAGSEAINAMVARVAPAILELLADGVPRIRPRSSKRWPAVPLSGLAADDPRRLAARIAEELLRAHGHLVAAEERVRSAAALRRRMLGQPDDEPGS